MGSIYDGNRNNLMCLYIFLFERNIIDKHNAQVSEYVTITITTQHKYLGTINSNNGSYEDYLETKVNQTNFHKLFFVIYKYWRTEENEYIHNYYTNYKYLYNLYKLWANSEQSQNVTSGPFIV